MEDEQLNLEHGVQIDLHSELFEAFQPRAGQWVYVSGVQYDSIDTVPSRRYFLTFYMINTTGYVHARVTWVVEIHAAYFTFPTSSTMRPPAQT